MKKRTRWGGVAVGAVLAVLAAGCVTDPGADPGNVAAPGTLAERLSGSQLILNEDGAAADAAGPMILGLGSDGRGTLDYAGLSARYRWSVEGSNLCLDDLEMGGMAFEAASGSDRCALVTVTGDAVRVEGLGAAGGRTMTGRIAPL